MTTIKINASLTIPLEEISFTTSRSGGPGGQHVNKVNSRVTLWFDMQNSPSLSEFQKEKITTALATRINKEGVLRIVSQKDRSQLLNKNLAIERFRELLQEALKPQKPRKKIRISQAKKQQRVEQKRQRSKLKQLRSKPTVAD